MCRGKKWFWEDGEEILSEEWKPDLDKEKLKFKTKQNKKRARGR